MKTWQRRLALGATAIIFAAGLSGCARSPKVYSMVYTNSAKDHYALLRELNRQGIGVIEIGQTLQLVLPTNTFFKKATTSVKQWRKYTLYLVGKMVRSYPDAPVTVSGNTDNVFTRQDRQQQSLFTATAVASYLWNHGESMDRVKIAARGDQDTVSSNKTPNGTAANRRVEVYIGLAHPY
jgi:outer membrane protein OmpA-like peptidoglycan-associated protein